MVRVILLTLLLTPLSVFAAEGDFFGPVVPACAYSGGEPCRACDLVTTAFNILKLIITVAMAGATVMLTYAGVLFVMGSASSGNLDSAKRIFWDVFIGLIIVLVAFLVVDLILRTLTEKSLAQWSEVQCVSFERTTGAFVFDSPPAPPPAPEKVYEPKVEAGEDVGVREGGDSIPKSGSGIGTPVGENTGDGLTNEEAIKRLEAAGVCGGTTGAQCVITRSNGVKTSFAGVKPGTIDQAIELHKACKCAITFSSVTDGEHSTRGPHSHINGYKIDVRRSPELDAFLEKSLRLRDPNKPVQPWGVGTRASVFVDNCGNVYARYVGGTIWDIQVNKVCKYGG